MTPGKDAYWSWAKGEAMSRENKSKPVPDSPKAMINEKHDEALDESFPASDPVSLGHSEHVGQPTQFRKKGSKLPAQSVRLKDNPRTS